MRGVILLLAVPAHGAGAPKDKDGDGIENKVDACRKEPETINEFQDEDGCPDELPEVRFVVEHDGTPLPEAELLVQSSIGADEVVQGSYSARVLPGVMWNVVADHGRCLTGDVRTAHTDTDRTVVVQMRMMESASVQVRPLAADGDFQTGVRAKYTNLDPRCPSPELDVVRNEPHRLAAGNYTLELTAPGVVSHLWHVQVGDGEEVTIRPQFVLPSLTVRPAGARVWAAFPEAMWVRPGTDELAALPPGTPVRVEATGRRPVELILNGEQEVALEPAGREGTVVVLAGRGDVLTVDDEPVPVGPDGTTVLSLERGKHELHVAGGGRDTTETVSIGAERVRWVRLQPPDAHVLLFGPAQVVPDRRVKSIIQKLAAHRGAYRFAVQAFRPLEGGESFDEKLVRQRTRFTIEALVAAGVPAEAIEERPEAPPFSGSASERRRVEVIPLPRE